MTPWPGAWIDFVHWFACLWYCPFSSPGPSLLGFFVGFGRVPWYIFQMCSPGFLALFRGSCNVVPCG